MKLAPDMETVTQIEASKPAANQLFWGRWRVFWGYCLVVGIFAITAGFFVFPSNGGIQSSFYSLVALPTLMILLSKPNVEVYGRWLVLFLSLPMFLALSSFWSDPTIATTYRGPGFFFKLVANLALLYLAVGYVVQTFPRFEQYWLLILAWLAGLSALVGMADYIIEYHRAIPDTWPRFKGIVWGGDTNRVAAFYTVGFLACIYSAYFHSGWRRVLSALCALPPVLVIALAQSKVPFLVVVATLVLLVVVRTATRDWRWTATGGILLITLGVWLALGTNTFTRVYSFFIRWELWQAAIAGLDGKWLLGTGLNYRVDLTAGGTVFGQPHNFLVDTLRFAGVVGVVLLLTQMVATLALLAKSIKHLPIMWFYGGWFLSGMGTALVEAQQPLIRPSYVWFLYWLPTLFIWQCYLFELPKRYNNSARIV